MNNLKNELPRKNNSKDHKWFNFQVLSPTRAILRGTYAMNHKHFKFQSRGKQGSACAVVSIIFGNIYEPRKWTKNHVDQVLEYGDKVYRVSMKQKKIEMSAYMTTGMIHPELFIEDRKCIISAESRNVYGNLFAESVGCPDFAEGVQRFFRAHNCGVVTSQGISVAMWQDGGNYFYFDPAPSSETGARAPEGAACLIRFKCLNDMQDHFLSNLSRNYDSRYCIDKLTIVRMTTVKRSLTSEKNSSIVNSAKGKSADCPKNASKIEKSVQSTLINKEPLSIALSNYKIDEKFATIPLLNQNAFDTGYKYKEIEINIPPIFKHLPNDVAILHGWTHESSEMYKGKGAQNIANCIMSIGMKAITDPRSWLRETLDQVLLLGDNLHADTKALKPNLKALTAADFNDTRFSIQGMRMFIAVDLMTVFGTLNSKIPTVPNLKQALAEFFAVHQEGIIESSTMAVAIWTQDDYFYLFDPRECDITGKRVIEEKKSGKDKKAAPTSERKVKGKCCVIRFSTIEELVTHFLGNISSAKKNDRFTVRHIAVVEDLPGLQPWFEFQPGEPGKTWILRGNLANDAEEFDDDNRGVQGLAIPVTALVNASVTPPQMWNKQTIDDAVREGNDYFNWCIPVDREDREMTLERLKPIFYPKNRRVRIKIEDSSVVGSLEAAAGVLTLEQGISEFFKTRQFGLVQVKNQAIAIWKFEEELRDKTKIMGYYYFNPNPGMTLNNEEVDEEAGASVVRAVDPDVLAKLIAAGVDPDVEGSDFFIHGFEVLEIGEALMPEDLEREKRTPIRPDLNAYRDFGNDGAVINATFDQANEVIFKPQWRDKQQAANALVALAMRQVYNPHLWDQEVVDDILKLGNKLTAANVENIAEVDGEAEAPRDFLRPIEIEDTFDIGINRFTVSIEEDKSRGPAANVSQLLEEYFNDNSMGILRQERVMVPIWKEGDVYFTMDPRGRAEQDKTASVFWFTTIASLASTIAEALNDAGEIIIDAVELENDLESRIAEDPVNVTEERWYNFLKKRDGIWELSGSISMAEDRFAEENRGKQGAPVAVVSTIFSKIYEPQKWSTDIINEVVVTGDKLFEKSVARLGEISNLSVNEIVTEFFLSNRRINLEISDCVESGSISKQGPNIQDLRTGVDSFFREHSSGILTISDTFHIPIWKSRDHFYCLISSEPAASTKVAALRFSTLALLSNYLEEIFGPEGDYEISDIGIVDWNKLPPWKHDPSIAIRPSNLPPLNAYRRLEGEARAILSGSTHQGSKLFPWSIRNKQTAANCVVSVAMSLIKDPVTWTKKTLDEILVIGNQVHEESIKFRETEGRLQPSEVVRIFHIGTNVLSADIDQVTLRGQVAIPPPEPELKGKGKGKAKKKAPKAKKKKKGQQKREPRPPAPTVFLQEGLSRFFEDNRAGILVIGNVMTAIWRDQGLFFIYDPQSRSDRGSLSDNGASCAMWFACVEPLFDLIFGNLEGPDKFGSYSISRIVVKRNVLEGLPAPIGFEAFVNCALPSLPVATGEKTVTMDVQPKSEFKIVDAEMSVLSGTISMEHPGFRCRGFQSTAMSAVSIVMGLLHVPSAWTPDIIDCVLKCGDALYEDSVRMSRSGTRCLSPSELLTDFLVGDIQAKIRIHKHVTAGILQIQDLTEALTLFFKNHCTGILHTPNLSTSVMQHCGKFYMFDSSIRNDNGRADFAGAACVIKCENIMRMAWIFINNCNYKVPSVYTLNAVDVLDLKFLSAVQNCSAICEN